jgi:hypothetical protein
VLERELASLVDLAPAELVRRRRQRFLDLGVFGER